MASQNFARALAFTLAYEGGWSDHPKDPGGATMCGVTLRTYRIYHPRATADDLRKAPKSHFEAIYRSGYWDQIGGDALPSGVDLIAFDIAVNAGVGRVMPWLHDTANLKPKDRIKALGAKRCGFWRKLATWATFGRGWAARENACLKAALALA
ncbi:lysozyme family protein [Rhodoblastus acidophilus]|uniref:glycoside hydrolase family 108 protein n=1 Tax=Rhodoblastus acidophilus TaxID=1074 RepID=UPI002225AC46|nr:glycosyl hydrolase 108 family protein [Rhodoblastus acidophilus]MCW2317965.1 lysozyme family protein [Rhodoblastus acidophilus]